MKDLLDEDPKLAKLHRKAGQAFERLAVARARLRVREKKNERTRYYRLGLVLETSIFDSPELLTKIEEVIRRESPRVRAAFALDRPPSWFERPARDDPKKVVDTRRVRLGVAAQQLLPGDPVLLARVKALIADQSPHVCTVFGMEHDELSWFELVAGR